MAKCYQCDHRGYFVGEADDYGGFLPAGAVYAAPEFQDGYIPRWTGQDWEQIENHKGEEGYLAGVAHTIKDYGPLPDGWSSEPPPPTLEEAITSKKAEVLSGYEAAFAPVSAAYPATEREGWIIQLEEARAVLADPDADTPTLALMVQERALGESLADFAALIVANNTFYRQVYASLTGQQQHMYRDVESMEATTGITAGEILAYPVKYQMPAGL